MTTTGSDVQEGRPVEIYRAANEMEAQVIKSFLESSGIPVMLQHEAISSVIGFSTGPLAEVAVFVPEPLADKAIELLESDEEPDEDDEEEDYEDDEEEDYEDDEDE